MLQMLNHGFVTGALFLRRHPYEKTHRRMIADLNGLASMWPLFTTFFGVFVLASLGLPGLNGFVGEFVLLGTFAFSGAHRARALLGTARGDRRDPGRGLPALCSSAWATGHCAKRFRRPLTLVSRSFCALRFAPDRDPGWWCRSRSRVHQPCSTGSYVSQRTVLRRGCIQMRRRAARFALRCASESLPLGRR